MMRLGSLRNPLGKSSIAILAIGVALAQAAAALEAPVADDATQSGARQGGAAAKSANGRPTHPQPQPPQAQPDRQTESSEAAFRELDRQYEQFSVIDRTFTLVARNVSPAVVHIVATKTVRDKNDDRRVRSFRETGSGVIVRDGSRVNRYVLTNNHVVEGALPAEIRISLFDGKVVHPVQVLLDAKSDVAVMDLGPVALPWARMGDSDSAFVGTWVLALGSPFGLTHSVSHGIISARGRHEEELKDDGVENQDFLQTDAAINPGNSGGPLVNMKGEVIGINTAIASNHGGSEGVGFSIPINLAKWSMRQLLSTGKVARGAMGVDLNIVFPEDAMTLGLDRPRGAKVNSVHPESPAALAGMQKDDIVIRFNGVEIIDLDHLINVVSMHPIGSAAKVTVWRRGAEVPLSVVVADRDRILAKLDNGGRSRTAPATPPRRSAPEAAPAQGEIGGRATTILALGLEFQELDNRTRTKLGLPESIRGPVIIKVEGDSKFSKYFQPMDVIETIDGKAFTSVEEFVVAFGDSEKAAPHEVQVFRKAGGSGERKTIRVP